jgi:hypothetical protein
LDQWRNPIIRVSLGIYGNFELSHSNGKALTLTHDVTINETKQRIGRENDYK